jgi:hypothetical protein
VILSDAAEDERHIWIGLYRRSGTGDVKKKKIDKAAAQLFADFPSR